MRDKRAETVSFGREVLAQIEKKRAAPAAEIVKTAPVEPFASERLRLAYDIETPART
jgi:hypothetical protein